MAQIRNNASRLHRQTFDCLVSLFPSAEILQEYKIRDKTKGRWLWLDFFIPSLGIAVEVQGQQHVRYNGFFHESRLDFVEQQRRDEYKEIWCRQNHVLLIKVYHNEIITPQLIWDKVCAVSTGGDVNGRRKQEKKGRTSNSTNP